MKPRIVIAGHGMVGHHFISQAIKKQLTENFEIHVFNKEPHLAYDRVQMSSYFEDFNADKLSLVNIEQYQQAGIHVHLSEAVIAFDKKAKTLTTEQQTLSYDYLVLATGSYPFVPPIKGNEHKNCLVYRTIDDLQAITKAAQKARIGAVVGGGLLGLEAAKALHSLGLETHVVEFAPQLMGVQLDSEGGNLLEKKITDLGISVHCNKATSEIIEGTESELTMCFSDDTELATDVIVFSAGIRPYDNLAKDCGLALGERGGIVINNQCQTSDENIFAIGECALFDNKIFGLVAPGYTMAQVALETIAGISNEGFHGADMSTKLKLLGVDVASIGDAHANTPDALSFTYYNPLQEVYKKLVTNKAGTQLLGAILVGDTSDYGNLLQLFLNDMPLPENPESLILPNNEAGGSALLGSAALPESAQICSCYNVSKGDICQAVDGGAHSLGDIKSCTEASTGCGGCTQLVKDVMNDQLQALGMEVNQHLCHHFAYSRQELYHLVRVNGLKSFAEIIEKHGQGQIGCEICKPTVASILASCWNDYILEDDHAGLQETNDYFLGNIQKNGTYSIVPRVPAGEITPEQLIALGDIAKSYDLYTKITGGQRVDLFGARLEQLPEIWAKLIDYGFETGHAYAKSLRTVKSCVGSTWCRYGVDDSVGLAIELENRYKGLRSPHKLKLAVSGCTRECAEAQSKDVGVIATENGWNLYVCGNGGMRPRHTDLLAADLDRKTLIRYIDRFFMFYIRTADKLQRTSVWLENLEGGIDYLKQVVIEDSLGIAQELEAEMALVIENYQCEWKTTLDNPEKLKRFKHFVNAQQGDPDIQFEKERGQIRPVKNLIAKAS